MDKQNFNKLYGGLDKSRTIKNLVLNYCINNDVDVIVNCKDGKAYHIINLLEYEYDVTAVKNNGKLQINITNGLIFEDINNNFIFIKNDNIGSFKVVSKSDNTKSKLVPNGSLEKVDYGGVDSGA